MYFDKYPILSLYFVSLVLKEDDETKKNETTSISRGLLSRPATNLTNIRSEKLKNNIYEKVGKFRCDRRMNRDQELQTRIKSHPGLGLQILATTGNEKKMKRTERTTGK